MRRIVTACLTALSVLPVPGAAGAGGPLRIETLKLEGVPIEGGGEARFSGTWTYATPRSAWRPTGTHTFAVQVRRCTARIGVAASAVAASPGAAPRLVAQATRDARTIIAEGAGHRVVRTQDEDGKPQLAAVTAHRGEGAQWSLLRADLVASRHCGARQLRDGVLPRALTRLVRDARLRAGS